MSSPEAALALVDWRRAVAGLYAEVRGEPDPRRAHERWRTGRDRLFREHSQSPLPTTDPMRMSGVPYWSYDDQLRFELELHAPDRSETLAVPSAGDGTIHLRFIGHVEVPDPLGVRLDVWWLAQYGGGIFLPVRDGTAGRGSYGGGRYLLDTAKGADLGGSGSALTLDFNFLYHPSCRYDPQWQCPLAPAGNTTTVRIEAGEML